MTNKELRRRETDKFGPYVQQVALDHANKRIAELEELLLDADNCLTYVCAGDPINFYFCRGVMEKIELLTPPPTADKKGE